MRERPILFSAPMVRALLDGSKTQTRRVIKGLTADTASAMDANPDMAVALNDDGYGGMYQAGRGTVFSIPLPRCPYGVPGDRLWVRETWQFSDWTYDGEPYVRYAADNAVRGFFGGDAPDDERLVETWATLSRSENYSIDNKAADRKWRPSIFMPRWACRLTLKITDVRVERLHDIREPDAIAEGITRGKNGWYQPMSCSNARWAYSELWNQINGLGAWDANPWVWVVSFRVARP